MQYTELPCNPSRTLTPDSVTDYEYDYDNRLVEVSLPTNSDTVEYTYDAMGRRLTKKFTYHNGANTDVTTYKYHYIGGQITEIEIDSIRNPGEGQTVLRNEEVKIHLGANSQPISYEWVKHVGESTTSATYYYHYDIHGNVLKVTDSSENIKITYTYDVLGKILTETNPDSVLNFFTFRGASQTIWDSEVGMYYSGGYYRPDTGTALQGTGAPVLTNPASGAMISAMAQVNKINRQMAIQARRAVKTAGATGGYTQGSSSGGTPGGFAPPPGPSDGFVHAGNQGSPPTTEAVEPIVTVYGNSASINSSDSSGLLLFPYEFECECGSPCCAKCQGRQGHKGHMDKENRFWEPDVDIGGGKKGEGEAPVQPVKPYMPSIWTDKNGDGYDDYTGLDKNGYNKQGYNHRGELNPAYDRDPSDDNTQYGCVIRDSNGNIVYCITRNKDGSLGAGYIYPVNEKGERTSTTPCMNMQDKIDNWILICNALAAGGSGHSVKFFDASGQPTSGSVGIQIDGSGTVLGIYGNCDGTFKVGQGGKGNFGGSGMTSKEGTMFVNIRDSVTGMWTLTKFMAECTNPGVSWWSKEKKEPTFKNPLHWDPNKDEWDNTIPVINP